MIANPAASHPKLSPYNWDGKTYVRAPIKRNISPTRLASEEKKHVSSGGDLRSYPREAMKETLIDDTHMLTP